MSLTNAASLIASRRNFPVTDGLWFLGEADSPNNLKSGSLITRLYDESGNGRHADSTNTGDTYEATGMNGKPCVLNNGDSLLIDGGADTLVTSKFSIFCVQRCTLQGYLTSGGLSLIASWWTAFNNSPLIINSASATVAQANTFGTNYGNNTPRAFTWCYDDTSNIRDWYENGVLQASNSSGWWIGTATGTFKPWTVGIPHLSAVLNNRIAILALYENKILNQREVNDLYFYANSIKGLIP